MTLVLEVEYLLGVSFAAVGPESEVPDWPAQPDRIFSALVATWAARGKCSSEMEALIWLEGLPAPRVLASTADHRTGAIVFVPPNDPSSNKQKHAKGVLPALRKRLPRRFPAARPRAPIVRFFWDSAPPERKILMTLQALARDTAYIGHSASLTRCDFRLESDASVPKDATSPERSVYSGRLAELRAAFATGRRPLPGTRVAASPGVEPERTSRFGRRWLLLEHVAGDMPDLRACAVVAKTLRDALMSGYRRIGRGDDIPEIVSGHAADGGPSRTPHLAIVPLPFVGFRHADGHVMGLALVPPRNSTLLEDETFRKAMRTLAPMDEERGRRILTLTTKGGTAPDGESSIDLSPTFEPPAGRRSLDPVLYTRPSPIFATVTPIVLDRHLKEDGATRQEEIAAQIVRACGNVGLPEPEEIVADKHSALAGTPSAYPSARSPAWLRWRLPRSLASRQLTHAVIRFSRPVEGPVILGAGRFIGLGLCRPLDPEG
jgi:CRISPR-associated protein Csb2